MSLGKRPRQQSQTTACVYTSRFVQWHPTAVVAIDAAPDGTVAAVARENGSIELWDIENRLLLKKIPGGQVGDITGVCWVHSASQGQWRLFSCGLDSAATEWDLESLTAAATTDSFGGAVWGMQCRPLPSDGGGGASDETMVALACDDGAARLFAVVDGEVGLQYRKTLPRVPGRTLCVCWHASESVLFSGTSNGTIHIWNILTGQEVRRITVGSGGNEDVCVWSLVSLSDGRTLVSGDSEGYTQMWDATTGTRVQGFKRHDADVTCVAAAPDGTRVFSSGVDNKLVVFDCRPDEQGQQTAWVFSDQKRPHTHDVRALAVVRGASAAAAKLLSGANDTIVWLHSVAGFLRKHPTPLCSTPEPPLLSIVPLKPAAPQQRTRKQSAAKTAGSDCMEYTVMSAHGTCVDVWQCKASRRPLDSRNASMPDELHRIQAEHSPQHLANIVVKGSRHIVTAALSSDGRHFAVSNSQTLSFFELSEGCEDGVMSWKVRKQAMSFSTLQVVALAFIAATSHVVVATVHGLLLVLDIENDATIATFDNFVTQRSMQQLDTSQHTARHAATPVVSRLAVSDGPTTWLAAVSYNEVHVYDLTTMQYHGHVSGTPAGQPVIDVAFSHDGSLMACLSAKDLLVYDVQSCSVLEWATDNAHEISIRVSCLPGSPAMGVEFCRDDAAKLIVHSDNAFAHFDMEQPVLRRNKPKRYLRATVLETEPAGLNGRTCVWGWGRCLKVSYLGSDGLALIEKSWADVLKQLPAPLLRHRYGGS